MPTKDKKLDLQNKVENRPTKSVNIVKNYSSACGHNAYVFGNYLYGINEYASSVLETLRLYTLASPFSLAIDMISSAISEIELKVWDKNKNEFVDHDVLRLLNHPNSIQTNIDFMYELAMFLLVTGNTFINATGKPTSDPLEIMVVKPQLVTMYDPDPIILLGDIPRRYQVSQQTKSSAFFDAKEVMIADGFSDFRYYNDRYGELLHIKNANPHQTSVNYFGMSKAQPLIPEIEQYVSGNINNLSLLRRGARPSVAWVNNRGEELTEAQYERIQDEAKKFKGAENAGDTPILDGMDIKEMSQNNRDMQFKELHDSMKAQIFNVYQIPLAMMSTDSMTFNNLETSQTQFYEKAAFPVANKITKALTRLLMYRYDNSEGLEITYCPSEITAMKSREIDTASKLSTLGVSTVNEIRSEIGLEPLEGGDLIYGSTNMTPILGEDMPEEATPETDIGEITPEDVEAETEEGGEQIEQEGDQQEDQDTSGQDQEDNQGQQKARFITRLKVYGWDDEKIEKYWERYGVNATTAG